MGIVGRLLFIVSASLIIATAGTVQARIPNQFATQQLFHRFFATPRTRLTPTRLAVKVLKNPDVVVAAIITAGTCGYARAAWQLKKNEAQTATY